MAIIVINKNEYQQLYLKIDIKDIGNNPLFITKR
jgi:hypothetical protein